MTARERSQQRSIPGLGVRAPPTIREFRETDIPAARRLIHERFGFTLDYLDDWLSWVAADSRPAFIGYTAADSDGVAGVGVAQLLDREQIHDHFPVDVDIPPTFDRVGELQMVAVRRDREGEGVGTRLLKRRLGHFWAAGIDLAVGLAWHRDDHRDSRRLFEAAGFEQVTQIDAYYAREGERQHCPDCGGACSCDASLWVRRVQDGDR